jgi:hypothetical protein
MTVIVKDRAGKEVARQAVTRPLYRFQFTVKRGDYVVSVFFYVTRTWRSVHVKAGQTAKVSLNNYPSGGCL